MVCVLKRIVGSVLVLSAVVGVFLPVSLAADIDNVRPFEIEEGRVQYELSGASQGTEILEFTHWGGKSVRRTKSTMNVMGINQTNNQLIYTDGLWIYNVNESKNTATKMKTPMFKNADWDKEKISVQTGEDMMKAMGGKVVGTETVLGKTCEWWEIQQLMNRTCVWKGIPLKSQSGMGGIEVSYTAVKIEIEHIPESHVSLPANVKIVEGQDPFEQLQKMQQMQKGPGMDPQKRQDHMKGQGTSQQDPMKMLEQIKKMQEEMKKRGSNRPQ